MEVQGGQTAKKPQKLAILIPQEKCLKQVKSYNLDTKTGITMPKERVGLGTEPLKSQEARKFGKDTKGRIPRVTKETARGVVKTTTPAPPPGGFKIAKAF